MKLYFYSPEQRRRDCGKIVANALQLMGGESTADNLIQKISSSIGLEELIEPEIKQVLRRAVRDGFLIKYKKTYSFPMRRLGYQTDANNAGRRKRNRSSSPPPPPPPPPQPGTAGRTPRKRRTKELSDKIKKLVEAANKAEAQRDMEDREKERYNRQRPKRAKTDFKITPRSKSRSRSRSRSKSRSRSPPFNGRKSPPFNFDSLTLK